MSSVKLLALRAVVALFSLESLISPLKYLLTVSKYQLSFLCSSQ